MIQALLWVIIMILVIVLRAFQMVLGLPEFNEFTALINKYVWITMGIQYAIVGMSFWFESRKNK